MNNLPVQLRNSLIKLQRSRVRLYLNTAKQFTGNHLVHRTWLSIAADLENHIENLRSLPLSFWRLLDGAEARLVHASIQRTLGFDTQGDIGEVSLRQHFAKVLDYEEPVILEVYAPIVRILRANWTDRALDVYVMVRSHLTQLIRLIEPFCGEPSLVQRCTLLVHRFEQDVQQPVISHKPVVSKPRPAARKPVRKGKAEKSRRSLGARPQRMTKHPKPLVRNIKLARGRARG